MRAVSIALCLFGISGASSAATFLVDSEVDAVDANPGDGICASAVDGCTLRAAVMEANALTGADEIDLPAGTYPLSIPGAREDGALTGDLDIADHLDVAGDGPGVTIVDADQHDRAFDIRPSVVAEISGVAISNGDVSNEDGGGIRNHGTLTLRDAWVSGNRAFGSTGGRFERPGAGGGIFNSSLGTAHVIGTTILGNSAFPIAGACDGIFPSYCPNGSALLNRGTAVLRESTIAGSSGFDAVGNEGRLDVINSTISEDSVDFLLFTGEAVRIHYSTLRQRHPEAQLFFFDLFSAPRISLRATVLDGRCTWGFPSDEGGNLESGDTCRLDPDVSWLNTYSILGPLHDNGGPTLTHEPLPGSPAIDAIPVDDCTWDDDGDPGTPEVALLFDQRGWQRASGPGCDIGAVEVPEPAATLLVVMGALVLASARRARTRLAP